ERFDIHYIDQEGEKKRPYMIHRALLGSIERFFGILIEHYAGKFPTWIAPVQVKVLSLAKDVHPYCETIKQTLLENNIRVELDDTNEKVGYKIRQGIKEKVPYMLIIGKKELEENTISIRSRDTGEQASGTLEMFIKQISEEHP
ncbi:MAG: threonyl-tRNA synthetase, partial [Candidatus Marinamargulisbacteria bacterium]